MIDRATVSQLDQLYRSREMKETAKGEIDNNFWVGVLNDAFYGTGVRSTVMNAVGGRQELIDVLHRGTVDAIDAQLAAIDKQIVALGGTP